MIKKIKNQYKILIILIILFIIDRTSKYLALNKLPGRGVYFFKYLEFKLYTNNGIAWGLKLPQFIIFSLIIIIIIFLFYFLLQKIKENKNSQIFCLGMIIIGAISNLIDRIIYPGVIDFIQIGIWPNFNLADTFITIGAIIFIFLNIKKDPRKI